MAKHQKANTIMMILLVTMAALCAMAQSGCTKELISMSPCINYISSNKSTPPSGCCSSLANVVQSQPQCLCQVLKSVTSNNQTQALELPKACNVQSATISECNVAAPTNAPVGTTTPSPSKSPSGTNIVPSTNNGSSDATSTRFASVPVLLSLLVATYDMVF
ncbi:non-specific lipid transfer protein GPI-anchored 5-like [Rutidosis leptorrhynchoides]|uniref:non-specific lipid transfer protein GPI-anchored 5-like n=1 Tax=Rutidosis leptorrhynchoides TaxID=125765 RepID=UPI003A99B23E